MKILHPTVAGSERDLLARPWVSPLIQRVSQTIPSFWISQALVSSFSTTTFANGDIGGGSKYFTILLLAVGPKKTPATASAAPNKVQKRLLNIECSFLEIWTGKGSIL